MIVSLRDALVQRASGGAQIAQPTAAVPRMQVSMRDEASAVSASLQKWVMARLKEMDDKKNDDIAAACRNALVAMIVEGKKMSPAEAEQIIKIADRFEALQAEASHIAAEKHAFDVYQKKRPTSADDILQEHQSKCARRERARVLRRTGCVPDGHGAVGVPAAAPQSQPPDEFDPREMIVVLCCLKAGRRWSSVTTTTSAPSTRSTWRS